MKTCIVIDDNEDAIKLMTRHIGSNPQLSLLASFTDPVEAQHYLESAQIDLVFVDIQMPQLTGLELIEILQSKKNYRLPHFILTTGYSEYALESYEYGVMDYIVKPVTLKRFSTAVDRYLSNTQVSSVQGIAMQKDNFFFADVSGVKTRIEMKDIVYIEGAGNYISIFLSESRIVLHKTMNSLIDMLDAQDFIRIHKSVVVSVSHIQGLRGNELFVNHKDMQVVLPIGITYKRTVIERLKIV
jgi:two-component system, LytTR family, response regulator